MFTGIVEEKGRVISLKKSDKSCVLEIAANVVTQQLELGDSVAVNGVCLTMVSITKSSFCADVMNQTLKMSSLGALKPGDSVNLERAMSAQGRFGGHIVSGHIDGTGEIISVKPDANAIWYTVSAAPELMRYIVDKGSVALDGISLTVAKVTDDSFSVSVIPHTAKITVLGEKKAGDRVNIENDIIAKYVEKLMLPKIEKTPKKSGITMEFLMENGF